MVNPDRGTLLDGSDNGNGASEEYVDSDDHDQVCKVHTLHGAGRTDNNSLNNIHRTYCLSYYKILVKLEFGEREIKGVAKIKTVHPKCDPNSCLNNSETVSELLRWEVGSPFGWTGFCFCNTL